MTRFRLRRAAIAVMVLLLATASIAQTAPPAKATPTNPASPTQPQPQLQERYPRYVIQRSDVLLLTFPLTPEFDQTVTVQPDGYVNLKNSGSVHVQGLTVPQMTEAVQTAYVHVLHEPIINVDLEDFQKPSFTVSGQVGKPGQYELRTETTVAEALAVAGGLTPTAKTQVFLFHRTSDSWFAVREVNMKQILRGKNMNEDATLQPGDMIYVPEKFITNFRKYVPYTLNAGTYLEGTQF